MIGLARREALSGEPMSLFDGLDDSHKVGDFRPLSVERNDHSPRRRVDLGPGHPVQPPEPDLDLTRGPGVLPSLHASDLDVPAAVPRPGTSLAPARRAGKPVGEPG